MHRTQLSDGRRVVVEFTAVPMLNVGDVVVEHGNVFKLVKRHDWGGDVVSFDTENVYRDVRRIPDAYLGDGWVIQGNRLDQVGFLLLDHPENVEFVKTLSV